MKIFLLDSDSGDHSNTYNLFRAREIPTASPFQKIKALYLYHYTLTYDDDHDISTPRDM